MKKAISFAVLLFLYTSCIKDPTLETKSLHLDRVKDQVTLLKSGLDSLEKRETLSSIIEKTPSLIFLDIDKVCGIKNPFGLVMNYINI